MRFITLIFLVFANLVAGAQSTDSVIKFIKANPKKASIYLLENGKTIVNKNGQQLMQLASAVKTIIAIEFANQVGSKKIDPIAKVAITGLGKYYIPNTDGGAHPSWLQSINKKATDSVTLMDIAKGMIKFSSNANTEFLQDLLGMENINKNLKSLNLKDHEPVYYFTTAALITCLKPADVKENIWIKTLSAMSMETYRKKCEEAHLKLKTDPSFLNSFTFANLSLAVQKLWSDKLVGSTTQAYATLMQKIVDNGFGKEEQVVLKSILEWPMEYAGNRAMFASLGQKGGSTAFILTDAFYAQSKNGDKIACAFFFNNLTSSENEMIRKSFPNFEANILTNKDFRVQLATAFK